VHGAAHGFLADRNIVSNARVHAGADVIVKIDIKDFFPTLTFQRVKGLLRKAGLVEQTATLCALLATEAPRDVVKFRGKTLFVATGPRALPQGAPTSPMITNAVCLRLDRRMSGLARKLGVAYTRYADDLTFSWRGDPKKAPVGLLVGAARKILAGEGFALNDKKTAVLKQGDRQKVTGLVVNPAPGKPPARVPRDVKRRLRAAIHNRKKGKPGKEGETLSQLQGMAAFVYMTDPVLGRRLLDDVRALS
jgi:RNA-directed DNA polymerase